MAFRRRMPFKRRFSRPRFRRRLRDVKGTTRWERADFLVGPGTTVLPSGEGSELLVYQTLVAPQMAWTNGGDPTGIVLGDITRSIEVGGIVFDYGFEHVGDYNDDVDISTAESSEVFVKHFLITDRLAPDPASSLALFPASIGSWSPFLSQFPVASFNVGSTPPVTTIEGRGPTRILWQKNEYRNFGYNLLDPDDEATVLYVPQDQKVTFRAGTVNRRLRLRVDDDHGLFIGFATANGGGFDPGATSRVVNWWAAGALYYRNRF